MRPQLPTSQTVKSQITRPKPVVPAKAGTHSGSGRYTVAARKRAEGTDARNALVTIHNRRQDDVLLPLPQMNDDPVRQQLDEAVTAALNLDPEWVTQIRQALSEEPSVTNRRFGT
ncbi:MAG: hypothetical protein F4W96_12865 [Chloroflexi bacterium]|nr:hypothetical protein [Chloroflexota bacterium]